MVKSIKLNKINVSIKTYKDKEEMLKEYGKETWVYIDIEVNNKLVGSLEYLTPSEVMEKILLIIEDEATVEEIKSEHDITIDNTIPFSVNGKVIGEI